MAETGPLTHPVPAETYLFVCLKCGRDDRFQKLGQKHYIKGRLCGGEVARIRYTFSCRDENKP